MSIEVSKQTDKRLLEREVNQARVRERDLSAALSDLPDLGEQRGAVPSEDLDSLRETLGVEKSLRDERIERLLKAPKRQEFTPPPPPEVPLEE